MQSGEITFGLKYLPDEPANTDAVSSFMYTYCRAVNPDSHQSAFIFPPESGFTCNMWIRIQEGKI